MIADLSEYLEGQLGKGWMAYRKRNGLDIYDKISAQQYQHRHLQGSREIVLHRSPGERFVIAPLWEQHHWRQASMERPPLGLSCTSGGEERSRRNPFGNFGAVRHSATHLQRSAPTTQSVRKKIETLEKWLSMSLENGRQRLLALLSYCLKAQY
jgi:hypothetical protein